jgi:hypothetical protein
MMWQMKKTQYRVSDFVSWQRAGSLELSPSFQRRPVWLPGAKSYFMDTIVRGLPVPIVFLREKRTDLSTLEPKREIVDGQQRMRTLFSYIDPSLLPDYDAVRDEFTVQAVHNSELANQTFRQLAPDLQHRILDYELSVHIMPSEVDDREVLQIFARMNATGVKLNDQELRNAGWFGEFKTSMYELAAEQLNRWREWRIFTEYNIARMEEVELTSEFAQLMLKGVSGKSQTALDRLYEQNDQEYPERVEIERRFRIIMDTIDDRLGNGLRFLPFCKKTLFYSLFAVIYDQQFGLESQLQTKRPTSLSPDIIAWIKRAGDQIDGKTAPQAVLDAIARRVTHPSSRKALIDYLRKAQ